MRRGGSVGPKTTASGGEGDGDDIGSQGARERYEIGPTVTQGVRLCSEIWWDRYEVKSRKKWKREGISARGKLHLGGRVTCGSDGPDHVTRTPQHDPH